MLSTVSLLDAISTLVAVRWFDAAELNSNRNPHSFTSLILIDAFVIIAVGILALIAERHLRSIPIAGEPYRAFLARVHKSWATLSWYFFVLLFVVAITRGIAAAGNISFILIGINPVTWTTDVLASSLGVGRGSILPIGYGAIGGLLSKPVGAYLYRIVQRELIRPGASET